MAKYMLLLYNPTQGDSAAAKGWQDQLSKEEIAAQHQRWARYAQDLKDAGAFVSNHGLKGPEAATTVRVRNGDTQVTDGPFAETKEMLGGYFVIEADDLDGAIHWAARVPTAEWGSVEIRPAWG
jgi:hypothetical protein